MLLVRWLLLFIVAFFIALVLVLTFIQPAFKQEVGVQLLRYTTRPLPVYLYVLGAFVAGLGLGVTASIYGFVRAKATELRKNRHIRALEQELARLKQSEGEGAPAKKPVPDTEVEPVGHGTAEM